MRLLPMTGDSSLTFQAYERLRADLLACRLRPGAVLRIVELARRLSVSTGAVREALSRLTSEGLVVAEPQRGFRAAPISGEDLQDLTEVRCNIEAQCLRRAIHHGDVAWEAAIVAALHRLSKTPFRAEGDRVRAADDFAIAHDAFHHALVAACSSTWLLRMRALLTAQSERYRRLSVPLAKFERNAEQEHRDIATAVLARDAKRATKLMSDHFRRTTQIVLAAGVADEIGDRERSGERDIPARRASSRSR